MLAGEPDDGQQLGRQSPAAASAAAWSGSGANISQPYVVLEAMTPVMAPRVSQVSLLRWAVLRSRYGQMTTSVMTISPWQVVSGVVVEVNR